MTLSVCISLLVYVHGKSEFTWMNPIPVQYHVAYSSVLFSFVTLVICKLVVNLVLMGLDIFTPLIHPSVLPCLPRSVCDVLTWMPSSPTHALISHGSCPLRPSLSHP